MAGIHLTPLDLTYVLHNDESLVSLSLALITLSPILLMASYAALAVQSREYIIIVMWAGQLASEGFNWLLKHVMKEARPGGIGNGYGFPSSHSQYMAYFGSFLMCHMYFRHRFATTGVLFFDQLWRSAVYLGLIVWPSLVAYSRYYLGYHSTSQVLWGVGIGILLGISLYVVAELIPRKRPFSILGMDGLYGQMVGAKVSGRGGGMSGKDDK
ncbi:Dolichyldiphosphatase 1 [Termitomyces sp. T112]|nr:Dolichyldiphosphatase 1 [Termitomyces sp. T112]